MRNNLPIAQSPIAHFPTTFPPQENNLLTKRNEFWAGVRATLPLVLGAIPFGIIFGALAVNSGISPAGTAAMSALVFAGSAQFIAAGLVAGGAGVAVIVLTTAIVNLRHALYSATLAPYLKHLPQRWLLPLGFWLTDESFAVVIAHFRRADEGPNRHWFFLGSAVIMYVNWQICTWIGIVTGQAITDPASWGLDFAMIVTFIGMLAGLIRQRSELVAAAVAGTVALAANPLPNKLGLILAALAGIGAGVAIEWLAERSDHKNRPRIERI